jgi:precorrin-3B C17-methyltransferase
MKTKLYILSFGAGGSNYLTQEALQALKESQVVVAYSKYARELEALLQGKTILTSGMTYENERCTQAIKQVKEGKITAILSNGDANVFGIASSIINHIEKEQLHDIIEVITLAGITSFLAVTAKVGAFLNDIALLNFSTKFNTLENIKKRFEVCMANDFTIGIYNPKSKKKTTVYDYFLKTLENYEERVAVIASNVGREKEKISILTTKELVHAGNENPLIGMATLIIIYKQNSIVTSKGLVMG